LFRDEKHRTYASNAGPEKRLGMSNVIAGLAVRDRVLGRGYAGVDVGV
jgi:hypothetical protein